MLLRTVFGLALLLSVSGLPAFGQAEKAAAQVGEKVVREGEKAAETWLDGLAKWWREKPPTPPEPKPVQLPRNSIPESGKPVAKGSESPIGLGRIVQEDEELTAKIRKRMKRCAVSVTSNDLKDVAKAGLQEALNKLEQGAKDMNDILNAAETAAWEKAKTKTTDLPNDYLKCVVLDPLKGALKACVGQSGFQSCVKANLLAE